MSKQHLTAEVFAETIPHVHNSKSKPRRKANRLSVAACALAIPGLLVTVAVPAYGAVTPVAPSSGSAVSSPAASQPSAAQSASRQLTDQSLTVSGSAVMNGNLDRATVKFVAPRRRVLTRWSPPSSANRIVQIAKRYLGVRYKFGGESPAGFDCSGLVAYVYAQVGIHLPHSAVEQGRIGHRVSLAAAVPGDVVVMNGGAHVGIYVGDHKMIDAPEPGRRVSVDKIYDNDYFIVRF